MVLLLLVSPVYFPFLRDGISNLVSKHQKDMKKINIKPLADRVLVEALPEHERGKETKSGIFIPETVDKERAEQGIVVAVGQGKTTDEGKIIPMSVKVGDKVIFAKYGPDEIKLDGKEYFILNESNILAVIE